MSTTQFQPRYRYWVKCEQCRLFAEVWFRFVGTGTFGRGLTFTETCPRCRGDCVSPGGQFEFVGEEARRRFSEITLEEALEFAGTVKAFHSAGVPSSVVQRMVQGYAPDYEAKIAVIREQGILLKAIVTPVDNALEGEIIRAVSIPWFEIISRLEEDPAFGHQIHWRKWEEIVAAAYDKAGFDEVILTPRSGDEGRDVIATKKGIGSIRIYDQVKAYKPGHLVAACEVREMIGILQGNVSKGVVTTTSSFAPGIQTDTLIKQFVPHRLELKPYDKLLPWLISLKGSSGNFSLWTSGIIAKQLRQPPP